MDRLLAELDPSDALSALVALELLGELADVLGPAAANLLCAHLAPRLPPLLGDPITAARALPIAAQLVARAAEDGPGSGGSSGGRDPAAGAGGAAETAAEGGDEAAAMGVDGSGAAAQLLHHLAAVLDDRCGALSGRSRRTAVWGGGGASAGVRRGAHKVTAPTGLRGAARLQLARA